MNAAEIRTVEEHFAAAPRLPRIEVEDARMRAQAEHAKQVSQLVNEGLASLGALLRRLRDALERAGSGRLRHS